MTSERFIITTTLVLFSALFMNVQAQTPSIEVTTDNDRAQFAVQGQAQTLHVEIFSPAGELVFEADSMGDPVAEWRMVNDKGERVADGVYLVTIAVTDPSGKRRKRIEQIAVSSVSQSAPGPAPYAVGPISGQGTTGKLAKFTGVNAIGNSVVTETVNKVGVNITPTATLQVHGLQPAALTTNGTAATTLLQTSGGKGGSTTGVAAGVQTAGAGASIFLLAGNGGDAPAGSIRGKGGNITLQPGSTGTGAGAAGLNGNVLIAPSGVGNVGIGTMNPTSTSKVEIAAQDGLRISGYQPFLTLRDTNGNRNLRSVIQGVDGQIVFVPNYLIGSGRAAMVIDEFGFIGVNRNTSNACTFCAEYDLGNSYAIAGTNNTDSPSGAAIEALSVPGAALRVTTATGRFIEGYDANSAFRRFHIDSNGTYVAGSDFAEALPAKGGKANYEPGDVLVLSAASAGAVEKSSRPYDARVAGIYSTRPGVLGAEKGGASRVEADELPVAVIGIVPTKVSAENGPIEIGDLLTTSATPGYAMRCKERQKSVGAIVGKAVEPLKEGKGIVKVLVMLR